MINLLLDEYLFNGLWLIVFGVWLGKLIYEKTNEIS